MHLNVYQRLLLPVLLLFYSYSVYAHALVSDAKALHVLNRLAFGPSAEDLKHLKTIGIDRYIDEQLSPESIPLPDTLAQQLDTLTTLHLTPVELFLKYGPPVATQGNKPDPEGIKKARIRSQIIVEQAVQARLMRAIESPRQLQEVMVDFWYNHFNVFAPKGLDHLWVGAYEEEAIRPFALGHFRDLLGATAKHPAMLFYLDNWQNTAPNSPGAHGQFQGLNENYARELMELHTLGVNGGYTQEDVIALARILTGWGLRRRDTKGGGDGYGFYFDSKRHDFSDKRFLGHTIKASGMDEGEQALDILAQSPATAEHISYELAQYFVADNPDPALVAALKKRYLETNGDIRAILKTLFHSPQFWQQKNIANKFKTPYQYVISTVRASAIPTHNVRPLYGTLMQLGMPLYACLTPDGYKNTQQAWLSPDAMTRRLSFAVALAGGHLPLTQPAVATMTGGDKRNTMAAAPSTPKVQAIDTANLMATLGDSFSHRTLTAVNAAPPPLRAALILGSPEFMRR